MVVNNKDVEGKTWRGQTLIWVLEPSDFESFILQ
jgi:hypothetical protein